MAISLIHAFVSAIADGGDASVVRPSNWNAQHTLTQATARVLGRLTAGAGAVEELTFAQVLANLAGTTTNDSAAAGLLGEYQESEVLVASAVALTTATPANVTSLSLTAGDWDVWATTAYSLNAATTLTLIAGGINTTSATFPTSPGKGAYALLQLPFTAGAEQVLAVGKRRLSLASTTTAYLVARADFAVNTCAAYGVLAARRVR